MIDLSKTFLQCHHCHHNFTEPRHVCPACDWPRAHSDKTPPPTWSQPDTSAQPAAQPAAPAPQIDIGIINVHAADAPLQLDLPLATPAPQATPAILPDITIPPVKLRRGVMRAAQTLTPTSEEPTGEVK